MSSQRGLLIAFEGGEGAGKSTQAASLVAWLTEVGHDVVATRQPGGTPLGTTIRGILLEPATGSMSPRTEALLYAADKAEHAHRVLLPALERGAVVVTDRYVDSTLAYQGAGRALQLHELAQLVDWATSGVRPDLTVLLDVDTGTGSDRLVGRDRLEAEPDDFHRRVRAGFRALAEASPDSYLVLDGAAAVDDTAAAVRTRVRGLLESRSQGLT